VVPSLIEEITIFFMEKPIKPLFFVITFTITFLFTSQALAIDCKKAAVYVERKICSNQRLIKADANLNSAYTQIYEATPDTEIKEMLVQNQKRWLKARNEFFGADGNSEEGLGPAEYSKALFEAIKSRTDSLLNKDSSGKFQLIATALEQRKFIKGFTGGKFSGFATKCGFFLQKYLFFYDCIGFHRYQNHNRVCTAESSLSDDNYYFSVQTFGNIVNGKLKYTAFCQGDMLCPALVSGDTTPEKNDWSTKWSDWHGTDRNQKTDLPKLDAEISLIPDQEWLAQCLTNPNFPNK
jgi:uncharacterized protein YecT (DUF1311 family)